MKDSQGREFKVGDVVVHPPVSWSAIGQVYIGIVVALNEERRTARVVRKASYHESRRWDSDRGEYIKIPGKTVTKTIIKCPGNSTIITNVIDGNITLMPEELFSTMEELKNGV